MIVLLFDGIFI